jgi:hypothetical protein
LLFPTLNEIKMVNRWEPGTQYDLGAVVEYEGHKYKIIQPHRSQGDWCPPVTPALWGRVPDDYGNDQGGYGGQQQGSYGQQQGGYGQQQQQQQYQAPPVPQNNQGGYTPHPDQKVDIPHEEQKKNWYDLDDHRKEQLITGGGLLAGAGLLAGGYMAWKHHEKSEEEKKALTWSLQNWIREAQGRTEQYNRNGCGNGVTWILNQGKNIPRDAIPVGEERGGKLYTCRAFQDGGIQLGKAANVFKKGAVIGYKNDEIHLETYEILVGNPNAVKWVQLSGRFNEGALQGLRPVEGGRENDGTPLFVCRAPHHNAVHPGKCSPKLDGCYIPFDGKEKQISNYEVLCYNN